MIWTPIFLGIWDIPVSTYAVPYLIIGAIGFTLCYLNRYFALIAIPVLLFFCVSDFRSFYRYNVGPSTDYIVTVIATIILAVLLIAAGFFLNLRQRKIRGPIDGAI